MALNWVVAKNTNICKIYYIVGSYYCFKVEVSYKIQNKFYDLKRDSSRVKYTRNHFGRRNGWIILEACSAGAVIQTPQKGSGGVSGVCQEYQMEIEPFSKTTLTCSAHATLVKQPLVGWEF